VNFVLFMAKSLLQRRPLCQKPLI